MICGEVSKSGGVPECKFTTFRRVESCKSSTIKEMVLLLII